MNMLFEITIDKNYPALMWLTDTFKDFSLIYGYAVMIFIVSDWIDLSIEIYIDRITLHKYE